MKRSERMKRHFLRILFGPPKRPVRRRHPNQALRMFEGDLRDANSSPFAAYMCFSDEIAALGAGPDWKSAVEDLEAEGSRLIGAVSCPGPHGAGGTFPHEVEMTNVIPAGCPSCKAAV